MNNIMLDIETMGQSQNAAIVAIGAVAFDTHGVTETFYVRVSLKDAAKYGEIDADTVLWWMGQEDSAREEITASDALSLADALRLFSSFVAIHRDEKEGVAVWGNGADFDNAIVTNAYRKTGIPVPWEFWENRCYRTIKNLFRDVNIQRNGICHKAVDDAKDQAKHLIEIARKHALAL